MTGAITFAVTVLDLSYDGCSLETQQVLVRGAKLRISIMGLGGAVEAAVRWVKNGRAGLRFDPEPEPEVQQIARTYERLKISTQVALRRVGRQHYHARLFNLTPVGCKVEFVERPKAGESLWVKFDSLDAVESTVRWVDGYYGGLQFVRPIYPAVFELLLKRIGA